MNRLVVLGVLIVATSLEATGDAVVRMGIAQNAWVPRSLLFLAGPVLLFGYGLSVNLAPVEFGRVVGLYIATLFIVWQRSISLPSDLSLARLSSSAARSLLPEGSLSHSGNDNFRLTHYLIFWLRGRVYFLGYSSLALPITSRLIAMSGP